MATGFQMQQRRATAAEWSTSNYVLAEGELGVTKDTGIIKIGDGVSVWGDLDPAFDSQFLPILGKAADSDLLDGINSSGFWQTADATTAATANKLALRTSDGRVKTATATQSDDATTLLQSQNFRNLLVSRNVTAAFTIQANDAFSLVTAGNSSFTEYAANIPTNASVSIPVGTYIDFQTTDKGPIRFTPAGGVTLSGPTLLYGSNSVARLLKTGTDTWLVHTLRQVSPTLLKLYPLSGQNVPTASPTILNLSGSDTSMATQCKIVDSIGSLGQYDGSTDPLKAYVRRPGWYFVNTQVCVTGTTTGKERCEIYVNGNPQHLGSSGPRASISEVSMHASGMLLLQLNDYVQMVAYQDSGSTQTVMNNTYAASFFEWFFIRPQ